MDIILIATLVLVVGIVGCIIMGVPIAVGIGLAIPFFVLAGVLMNSGGIAGRLIDAAKVLTGRMPNSLAHTNVLANALFGAVSGAAVNVASAPAGMLIPPSNTFIVYSLVSSTSVAALFMAGVGPGLIWLIACMIVVAILGRTYGGGRGGERPGLKLTLLTLWRAVPSLLMIVIVVGGILSGYFTWWCSFRRSRCGCPPSWASPDLVGTLGFGRVGSRS